MGSGNYSHDKRQLAGEDVAFVKLSINKYELGISDWAPTEVRKRHEHLISELKHASSVGAGAGWRK